MIVSGTERCANEVIFADVMVPGWDRDTVKYFTPYPVCGGYTTPGQWYIVGGESQVVGPICECVCVSVCFFLGGGGGGGPNAKTYRYIAFLVFG